MVRKKYILTGEIDFDHNAKFLSRGLGISQERVDEIIAKIIQYMVSSNSLTRVVEKILEDEDLAFNEKIYSIFAAAKIYHIFMKVFGTNEEG